MTSVAGAESSASEHCSARATYSFEDDKLRLYFRRRPDEEITEQLEKFGFKLAPLQELYFAPNWTPARVDFCLQLAPEIEEEETSLAERAEQKAARCEGYSSSQAEKSAIAYQGVRELGDRIPGGQPITLGHHSTAWQKRVRERMDNGMRRSIAAEEKSAYWSDRAARIVAAAARKDRPAVRQRRINKRETEHRKWRKDQAETHERLKFWSQETISLEAAIQFTRDTDGGGFRLPSGEIEWEVATALERQTISLTELRQRKLEKLPRQIHTAQRWLDHLEDVLEYERAMLVASGGTPADRTKPEKDGACRCLQAPGHGAGWCYIIKVNSKTVTVKDDPGYGTTVRTTTVPFDKLVELMSAADVQAARDAGRLQEDPHKRGFFLLPFTTP